VSCPTSASMSFVGPLACDNTMSQSGSPVQTSFVSDVFAVPVRPEAESRLSLYRPRSEPLGGRPDRNASIGIGGRLDCARTRRDSRPVANDGENNRSPEVLTVGSGTTAVGTLGARPTPGRPALPGPSPAGPPRSLVRGRAGPPAPRGRESTPRPLRPGLVFTPTALVVVGGPAGKYLHLAAEGVQGVHELWPVTASPAGTAGR
jgi:hypothetical protein